MQPNLTVWYNTKCPVCDAGVGWQKRRLMAAARAGVIEFRDINLEPEALARFGAGLEDIRRRLHGVDADGRLRVGIDCAVAIWRLTPGTQWLGAFVALPGVHGVGALRMTGSWMCSTPGTGAKSIGSLSLQRHCHGTETCHANERVLVAQHKASAQKPTSEGPTCDSSSRSLGSRTFRAAIGRGNHWRWR